MFSLLILNIILSYSLMAFFSNPLSFQINPKSILYVRFFGNIFLVFLINFSASEYLFNLIKQFK